MTAGQRQCPACGSQFTWTSAAPRQRFCSTRCKHQWWNARRRQATAALTRDDTPAPGDGSPPAVPGDRSHGTRHHDGPGTVAAVPACPHCRNPVAIVAWLVPPAAASVATPPQPASPRHADTVRDNQSLTE